MQNCPLAVFLVAFLTTTSAIDPTLIWDLVKLLKDVANVAETVNDIQKTAVTYEIYEDLQKMRKAFERDIPDLKETILEQRFEQDVEFPTNIVFESANDFFKRPNPFTRFQLQLACQKYNPTFVLKKLSMMLAGKGRSWFLQQLEALHFSSLKAEILAKRVEASLEELVLNEAFCASLDNLHDEISLQNSVNLAENISRLLTEQKEAAVDFYYPQHFRIFAEQFVDGFDAESCGSRVHCNRNLTLQLEAALRKEFDYGQIHSVRVSSREPYFTGRIPPNKVIQFKANGFHVLIFTTNPVTETPIVDASIQAQLDAYDSFFMLENRLCNWNPFNPVGTLQNVFNVLESSCRDSDFCVVTKTDYDAHFLKAANSATKSFYFSCFPFLRGLTVIQGSPQSSETYRVVFADRGSLWQDALQVAIKIWRQKWENAVRTKRHLPVAPIAEENVEVVASKMLQGLEQKMDPSGRQPELKTVQSAAFSSKISNFCFIFLFFVELFKK